MKYQGAKNSRNQVPLAVRESKLLEVREMTSEVEEAAGITTIAVGVWVGAT